MNAPTVPAAKKSAKKSATSTKPKVGSDYVVAAPSHENPNSLSIIMSVTHTTLEY